MAAAATAVAAVSMSKETAAAVVGSSQWEGTCGRPR